ncbi:Uncharacterised protein r2_g3776 [Pycnogonum litorale]
MPSIYNDSITFQSVKSIKFEQLPDYSCPVTPATMVIFPSNQLILPVLCWNWIEHAARKLARQKLYSGTPLKGQLERPGKNNSRCEVEMRMNGKRSRREA